MLRRMSASSHTNRFDRLCIKKPLSHKEYSNSHKLNGDHLNKYIQSLIWICDHGQRSVIDGLEGQPEKDLLNGIRKKLQRDQRPGEDRDDDLLRGADSPD